MWPSLRRITARVWERATASLWRVVASRWTAWVLLGLLFAVALVGGLVPQMSGAAGSEASSQEQVLSEVHKRLGAVTDILESLGWFHIYRSQVMRTLLAGLGATAFLRLLLEWIPSWVAPPGWPTTTLTFTLSANAQEVWSRLARAARDGGQRLCSPAQVGEAQHAAIRRAGVRRWLGGLLYLGILCLLLASWVSWRYSWRGPRRELALGETEPIAAVEGQPPDAGGELSVRLEQIALYPARDALRLESQVSIARGQQAPERLTLGPGRHAAYGGFSLYQLGYGPAARISARDAEGHVLSLLRMGAYGSRQNLVRLRFAAQQQEQTLAIPEANVVLRLVYYPELAVQGTHGRALQVQFHRGQDGGLLAERFLTQDGVIVVGRNEEVKQGLEVNIAFEYYVVLRAEREPELPLAALGGLSILVGFVAMALWPPQEAWITVQPRDQGCTCRLVLPRRDAGSPWVRGLAALLQETPAPTPERGHA